MLCRNLAALPVLYFALVVRMADVALAEPRRVLSTFQVDPFEVNPSCTVIGSSHATP